MKRGEQHGEEAQALIEFAFFAVILLYFFLGTVDFGRFLYYDNAVRSAARVGAEVASNHCAYAGYPCGTTSNGNSVTDNYVIWSAYCEAAPYVNLNLGQYAVGQPNTKSTGNPAYSTRSPMITGCTPDDTSATWTPTCAVGGACANCVYDICVAPTSRSSGTVLSVSVGYDFRPITPLMGSFFPARQCWLTSDTPTPVASDSTTNGHTLCGRSAGRVY